MAGAKSNAALNAVKTMLVYYHEALVAEGCQDPKREMATVLPYAINLSEAQTAYVQQKVSEFDLMDILDNSLVILSAMILESEKTNPENLSKLMLLKNTMQEIKKRLGGTVDGSV